VAAAAASGLLLSSANGGRRPRRGLLKKVVVVGGAVISTGACAATLGAQCFDHSVCHDVDAMLAEATPNDRLTVTEEMLESLPPPVNRYLSYTGVVGKTIPRTVYLAQSGRLHLGPGQPWLSLRAKQYYSVQPPGFVWDGTVRAGPVPIGRARDMYLDAKGSMLVKALSLFGVVDAKGEEIDQGAMVRYLSEMVWFPSAFLLGNVSFDAVDERAARVTLTDQGRSVTGTLTVDPDGRLTGFAAERFRVVGNRLDLETWWTPVTEYGELAGLRLPVRGKAVWRLADGDLEYIDVRVDELVYDPGPTFGGTPTYGGGR
jgi:Family of unknown function (DUF6544)